MCGSSMSSLLEIPKCIRFLSTAILLAQKHEIVLFLSAFQYRYNILTFSLVGMT